MSVIGPKSSPDRPPPRAVISPLTSCQPSSGPTSYPSPHNPRTILAPATHPQTQMLVINAVGYQDANFTG